MTLSSIGLVKMKTISKAEKEKVKGGNTTTIIISDENVM